MRERGFRRWLAMSVCAASLLSLVPSANAAGGHDALSLDTTPSVQELIPFNVEAGAGRSLSLPASPAKVFIVDPKIAKATPTGAASLFIEGVSAGRTTLSAMDADGHHIADYQIVVGAAGYDSSQVESQIRQKVKGSNVSVRATPKGLILSGTVPSSEGAGIAEDVAKGFLSDGQAVMDHIQIKAADQVTLVVRVAEMDRNVVRQLGIDWQAASTLGKMGSFPAFGLNINASTVACVASHNPYCLGSSVNGVMTALAQDNLVRMLAEPNLTVLSGQTASFQVGGQYPVPMAQQAGAISVGFKSYGISLSFLPTVFSNGHINLHVAPEVSQLSNENSVSVTTSGSTSVIPALTVRRADTTVEMGSGETLAIAGLLEDSTTNGVKSIPGAGDIPIIGSLFRNTDFKRTEMELVILVTPYIVKPVADRAKLSVPTDMAGVPTEIERLLLLRQVTPKSRPVPMHVPGDAGFFVQ